MEALSFKLNVDKRDKLQLIYYSTAIIIDDVTMKWATQILNIFHNINTTAT